MNSITQLTKKACLIFCILFFIAIPIVWASLFFTNYHGDLTRIGKWMEADFGWQKSQPVIDPELLVSSPIKEADILVIGDSFSESLYWQSVFTKAQLKVATLTWSQIGDICEDFPEKLKATGYTGKTIIIESIERIAHRQFKKSANCKVGKSISINTARTVSPTPANIDLRPQLNLQGQFVAGLETIFHSVAIRTNTAYTKIHNYKSKGTEIHEIKDGCTYFSNRLCQFGLFFHEDYQQSDLTNGTLTYIEKINQRLSKYSVIWMIIPNKSSVYHKNCTSDFWALLQKKNLGPNLLKDIQESKSTIKDLYNPNDTHLSSSGYLFAGRLIYLALH